MLFDSVFKPNGTNGVANGTKGHTKDDVSSNGDSSSSGTATPIHTDSLTIRQPLPEMIKPTMTRVYESTQETYILKDTTTLITVRCKKEFPSKVDDILTGVPTCHAFLDFIATERLRSMPHKGSKWDKVLKWAEGYSRKVDAYSHAISGFAPHSWESARLVWGCCRWLLRMGPEYVEMLEKIFGVMCQIGQTLDFFLKNKRLFCASVEIQDILALAYSDLIRFTVETTIHYKKTTSICLADFDILFGRVVDSFFHRKECFTSESWACSLREESLTTTSTTTIHIIRQWLSVQDRTLDICLSNRMGTRTARYEFTCEWFESHMREFQRDRTDVLWVCGKSGSGKSVLSGWILERLRRTQGTRNGYDVISYAVDANLKSERSSFSIVRSLLLQLLERNVGDLSVYKILSALYERAERSGVTDNLEAALWKAFDSALGRSECKLMIVIDGLDHLDGGEPVIWELCERLRCTASKYSYVKCLLLSRPLSKPCPSTIKEFVIEATCNTADIKRFVDITINSCIEFKTLKVEERRKVVETITQTSSGTFVWAEYSLQLLRMEKTVANMMKCLDTLSTMKTLDDILHKLILKLDLKQSDTKLLICLLLAAERPLTVQELGCLFEIDVTNCSRSARLTKIEDDIRIACGSLVTIRDGLVCFSHVSVKDYLMELCLSDDDFPLSIEEAHTELTIRSLGYMKISLKGMDHEPTLECGWDGSEEVLQKHQFLEYAARHYVIHFKQSTMYNSKGSHSCSATFKACFPNSSFLAFIEGSWWETQTCASEAAELHHLALQLRKIALGEKCVSVVQCYINLARTQQNLSSYVFASESYYETWKIVCKVLGETHAITRACAKAVITCTELVTTTTATVTRTETIIKRKETIYKYMYTHCETSEEKITYAKVLAELYIQLKRTEEALTIYHEIRKVCIEVYGELHEETTTMTRCLTKVLEVLEKHEECITITRKLLEICEKTTEVWEEKRITTTITMVEVYEKQKEIKKAEELLISLCRSITEVCRTSHEEHYHEAKIKITLEYVRFLERCSRDKEAEKILIELWNEFKGQLNENDCNHGHGLLIQIRIIGDELKKWKIVAVAESVFSSLWGFYKRTSRTTSKEATSIAIKLSEVLNIKQETHSEETILKEIFKTTSTKTTVDITVIKTCTKLSAFYEREERWAEAISVCTKSLVKIWSSLISFIESRSGICALPAEYFEEAIMIARRLAICYFKAGHIHNAESVYIYIFSACRSSLQVHDEYILSTAEFLVTFYESIGKIDQALKMYQELYEEYQEVLGCSHTLTVKITYKLAHFCTQHQPRKAEQYYLVIVTSLGHRTEILETTSIEAVLVLCRIYETDKKYSDALKYYRKLWLTFCRRGEDCGMSTETVLNIYQKYVYILERESQFSIIYDVTIQFREACIKHYGKHHHISVLATIELARVLEREESKHQEAIVIYEEVRKIISEHSELRIIMQATIVEVRKRLAQLYAVHTSSSSKAEVIYIESWEEYKCKHGCSHEESLSRLYELIMFFKKQSTKECTHTATITLQTTIIEIITKEKDTQRLFFAAGSIAKLYLALGLKELAFELLQELSLQLNSVEVRTSKKFGFSLRTGHTLDRRSFLFVVAFEETLRGNCSANLYAELMTDLVTETTLYESWMRTLKYGGSFESSLSVGARLRLFLVSKHREEECNRITEELWELFQGGVGKQAKKSGIIWELFLICVREMGVEEHDLTVLETAATTVVTHYEKGDFAGSHELATWTYQYVKVHGGFIEQRNLAVGFKISLCMAGKGSPPWKRCQDEKLKVMMMELSRTVLAEVLKASESEHMSFSKMRIEEVNLIVGLLGEQQNFKDLERILRDLWEARQHRASWSADVIVSIGHRLCEVLFASGKRSEAIDLCNDIRYNVKRVWGAVDASTVLSYNLLSGMYTASGSYDKAMELHVELLRETLAPENEDELVDVASGVILQQMKLLKRSYQRLGRWIDSPEEYRKLWDGFEELFDHTDDLWKGIDHIKTWSPKPTGVKVHEGIGMWKAPGNWCFLPNEDEKKSRARHACHLRSEDDD